MIGSGVESLDGRIGGLIAGGTYAFFGPAGSGKSILGLHFLLSGLERNEACVLITRDDPVSVDSRAAYIGYGPARLTMHPRLRVIQLPDHLPPNLSAAPDLMLTSWLEQRMGSERPRRVVLDNLEFLVEYSHTPNAMLHELTRFLGRLDATTYVLTAADSAASPDESPQAPILQSATGAFVLEVSARGLRTLLFHRAPPQTFRAEPLPYSLRSGGGFSEDLQVGAEPLEPAERRRVVVIDELGALSADVITQLSHNYELETLSSAGGALGKLSSGRFGALVLVVDPFDEGRAFDLAFALRREGNGAPIVFAAPSRGLRSSTRARGLRIGGDDFFIADLPTGEIIERIQMAWSRGGHRRNGLSQIGQIIQPMNGNGLARPMTQPEFLRTMERLLSEEPPLLFCYLEFTLREDAIDMVWPALRTRVRIGDGDIIGALTDRRVACVLDRITPEQTARVVERIKAAHPALQVMTDVTVIPSPTKLQAIRNRLHLPDAGPSSAHSDQPSANSAASIRIQ